MTRRRYSDFAKRIDLDALYEAIGYEVLYSRGNEDIGRCFDLWGMHKHGDTTGKFSINREKCVYNCFVCSSGSLLSLIMEMYDLEADDATEWLYSFADGHEKSSDEYMNDIDALLAQITKPERIEEVLPYFNPKVIEMWEVPTSWAQERRISPLVAKRARLGHNPHATKYAPRRGEEPYRGPAIIFPHFVRRKLVGWQYRWLEDDRPKWCPKYSNTPDFPKSTTLYNMDRIVRRAHPIVIVESAPTTLYLESLGVPSVATFGASITDQQLKLMRRFQQGIIVAADNDKPGIEALVKIVEYLDGFIPVSYIEPAGDSGDDLADNGLRWSDKYVRDAILRAEKVTYI